jgi:hypothetical protein
MPCAPDLQWIAWRPSTKSATNATWRFAPPAAARYIPALNSSDAQVALLAQLVSPCIHTGD